MHNGKKLMIIKNSNVILAFALMMVIFIINYCVREQIITYETLVSDDLIYVTSALNDTCFLSKRGWFSDRVICYVMGAKSIFWGRIFFIVTLSISGALLFNLLRQYNVNRPNSLLCSLAIFSGIPVLSQATFITGTHPLNGLVFMLVSLSLVAKLMFGEYSTKKIYTYSALAGFGMLLAGIATPMLILASLVILPASIFVLISRKWVFLGAVLIATAIIPSGLLAYMEFSGAFSNHYQNNVGWIKFDFTSLLSQANKIKMAGDEQFGALLSSTLLMSLVVAVGLYLYRILQTINRGNSELTNYSMMNVAYGIFIAGFIVSLAPALTVSGAPPRYTFIPFLFLVCLFYLQLDSLVKAYRHLIVYSISLILGVCVAFISVTGLFSEHDKLYKQLAEDQHRLKSYLEEQADSYQVGAQILIILSERNIDFTSGFNHWSTNFIRHATGRRDLIGVIGPASKMKEAPFVGEYFDHDKKYWGKANGKSYRKKMIGLDLSRGTYIHNFQEGKKASLDCIFMSEFGRGILYTATPKETALIWERSVAEFAKAGESMKEYSQKCAAYKISTMPPIIDEPNEVSHSFKGDGLKGMIVKNKEDTSSSKFSIMLKSRPQPDQSYQISETTPPMPILGTPLVVYQVSDSRYKIVLKCDEEGYINLDTAGSWTKLTFSVDKNNLGILSVNGIDALSAEGCSVPKKITIGKGYKNRYWSGDVSAIMFQ